MALKHGMGVKTLSTIIGHVSSGTTLNIYTYQENEGGDCTAWGAVKGKMKDAQ